ncbi:hypothetical protein BH09MYX1_BH09MYX1_37520 [soil metagenome]
MIPDEVLRIRRRDGKLVAQIERRGGVPQVIDATSRVSGDLEKWLREGLVEAGNRRTRSTDRAFFERIASCVRRLGMDAVIERIPTPNVGVSTRGQVWVGRGDRLPNTVRVEARTGDDVRA